MLSAASGISSVCASAGITSCMAGGVRIAPTAMRLFFSTLLVAEQKGGKLTSSTLSAATAAKELNGDISVMLAGGPKEAAEAASRLPGVDKVYHCNPDDSAFEHPVADSMAVAVAQIVKESGASHVFAGSSSATRESVVRAAALLNVQPITDIIKILGDDKFQRFVYSGQAVATAKSTDAIKVCVIHPTSFEETEPAAAGCFSAAQIVDEKVDVDSQMTWVRETDLNAENPQLETARVVVSGGRGMRSADNFKTVLGPLCDKLHAALGASRAAVDEGEVTHDLQIGSTGKKIRPELHIACGISGASQYIAGITNSRTIVAVNKDPNAPIFNVADYGVVGDLFKVVPELTSKL